MITLTKKTEAVYAWTPTTYFISMYNGVYGGQFTVTEPVEVAGVGWNVAFPEDGDNPGSKHVRIGLWSKNGANPGILLADWYVHPGNVGTYIPWMFSPHYKLTLDPSTTYVLGAYLETGKVFNASDPRPMTNVPSVMTLGLGKHNTSGGFAEPTTTTGASGTWYGDIMIKLVKPTDLVLEEPPEPLITRSNKAFTISLDHEWVTADLTEWDLQFAWSYDGTTYTDWQDVGTFNINKLVEPDGTLRTSAMYQHAAKHTSDPIPFYAYRYKLRSATDESAWSEIGYAGRVLTNTVGVGGAVVQDDEGNVTLAESIAGNGLTFTNDTLNVGPTPGRTVVTGDAVDISPSYTGQTSIETLGVVTSGTWSANVISAAYIDALLARLDGTQTFTGTNTFNNRVVSQNAFMGNSPGHGASYAQFSYNHTSHTTGNYSLLQSSGGATYLNSASGQTLYLRQNNTDLMTLSATQISASQNIQVNTGGAGALQLSSVSGRGLIGSTGSIKFSIDTASGFTDRVFQWGKDALDHSSILMILNEDGLLKLPAIQSNNTTQVGLKLGHDTSNNNLNLQAALDSGWRSSIFHNAYYIYNGTAMEWRWSRTHATFGSRGIVFDYGSDSTGIDFYADRTASTVDTAFTPTQRFTIRNDGNINVPTSGAWINIAGSTGQYRVNGAQISSANLSDSANIAHINTAETITGGWTFNSTLTVRPSTTAMGYVSLVPGTAAQAGYIQWHNPDGTTRIAYMGWSTPNLTLQTENGAELRLNQAANSAIAAEKFHTYFTTSTQTFSTSPSTQRNVLLQAPTYAATAAGQAGGNTITNAATLAIAGAPTAGANMTITNAYALWVQGGTSYFSGEVRSGTLLASVLEPGQLTAYPLTSQARIYTTNNPGSGAYPFDATGHLIYQTRTDSNRRDHIFGTGNASTWEEVFRIAYTTVTVPRALSVGTTMSIAGQITSTSATGFVHQATDFNTGVQLQSTTASSTRSTNLVFRDNQATPNNVYVRKEGQNTLDIFTNEASTGHIWINPHTATISFGTAMDTNLYRSAANELKTDDDFRVGSNFLVTASTGAITIQDTNLYRAAGDVLKTDDHFEAVGAITARRGAATEVGIGRTSLGVEGTGIYFGSAGDTNLYRASANVLRTDDKFEAALGATFSDNVTIARSGGGQLLVSNSNAAQTDAVYVYSTSFGMERVLSAAELRFLSTERFRWNMGATTHMLLTGAGQLQLPITGSAAGLVVGGDASLYRDSTNSFTLDKKLTIVGVGGANSLTVSAGFVQFPANSLDAASLADGSIQASKIGFVWNGGNVLRNSHAGTGTDVPTTAGWLSTNATITATSAVKFGIWNSFMVDVTAASTAAVIYNDFNTTDYIVPGTPTKQYVGSAFVRGAVAGRGYWIRLTFYQSDGVTVTGTFDSAIRTDLSTTEPTRIYIAAVAPTNTARIRIGVHQNSTGTAATDVFYVGSIQLEQTELNVPSPYGPPAWEILPGTLQANMIRSGIISGDHIVAEFGFQGKRFITDATTTNPRITIEGGTSNPESSRGIFSYGTGGVKRVAIKEGSFELFENVSGTATKRLELTATGGLLTSETGGTVILDSKGLAGYNSDVTFDNTTQVVRIARSAVGSAQAGALIAGNPTGQRIEIDRASFRVFSDTAQTISISSGIITTGTNPTSGARTTMDSIGIHSYDSFNIKRVMLSGSQGFTLYDDTGFPRVTAQANGGLAVSSGTGSAIMDHLGLRVTVGIYERVSLNGTDGLTLRDNAGNTRAWLTDAGGLRLSRTSGDFTDMMAFDYSGFAAFKDGQIRVLLQSGDPADGTKGGLVLFDSGGVARLKLTDAGGLSTNAGSTGSRVELDGGGLVGYNSSNVRSITADSTSGKFVAGGTLTGTTWSGARMEMDLNGLRVHDASAQLVTLSPTTGLALKPWEASTASPTSRTVSWDYISGGNDWKAAIESRVYTDTTFRGELHITSDLRTSTGNNGGRVVVAGESPAGHYSMLDLHSSTLPTATLSAWFFGNDGQASVRAQATALNNDNFVKVQAGLQDATLLKGDGTSDWAFASKSNLQIGIAFSAHKNSAQQTGIVSTTWTKVTWTHTRHNPSSAFLVHSAGNPTGTSRFVSARAGYYRFSGYICPAQSSRCVHELRKYNTSNTNVENYRLSDLPAVAGNHAGSAGSALIYLAVGEYVESWVWMNPGGSIEGVAELASFQGEFVGA